MSSQPLSPMRKAWYRWKSLKLPWRKRFLVGLDLQGNTFWEFKDAITSNRMRRIVQYPHSTHYSEIKISPQWHQWLRHTRFDPPSLTEQSQDLVRQEQLKVLAAKADARWAAKPSFLDAPTRQQPLPATEVNHPGAYGGELEEGGKGEMNAVTWAADEPQGKRSKIEGGTVIGDEGAEEVRRVANQKPQLEKRGRVKEQKEKEDPWKQARGGPSEEWQPQAWSGGTAARRG